MSTSIQEQPLTRSYLERMSSSEREDNRAIHMRMGVVLKALREQSHRYPMTEGELTTVKDYFKTKQAHMLMERMMNIGEVGTVRFVQNSIYNEISWMLLSQQLQADDPSATLLGPLKTIDFLKRKTGRRELTKNQLPHGIVLDNPRVHGANNSSILGAAYYYLPAVVGPKQITKDSAIVKRIEFLYYEGLLTPPASVHVVVPRDFAVYEPTGSMVLRKFQICSHHHPFTMQSSESLAVLLRKASQL